MSVKKALIILIILAVIIVIGLAMTAGNRGMVEYVTARVERGELIQTVSETGTVKAASEIEMNFPVTGKIANIPVRVGDRIDAGDTLAELDYSALLIKHQEAEANLAVAKAKLDKLLAGATPHEVAVADAGVSQAKAAYDAAVRELSRTRETVTENIAQAEKDVSDLESDTALDITTQEQAVTTAETDLANDKKTYQKAINNKKEAALTTVESKLAVADTALDMINTVITDDDAENVLSKKDISYLDKTKSSRLQAVSLKDTADGSLTAAQTDDSVANIDTALTDALAALNRTLASLNYCFEALKHSLTSSSFTQTNLDAFKTNISTQITNVTTGISAVQTAQQNLDDAILDYDTAVADAENYLATARANLSDARLTAKNALSTARISGNAQITAAESKVNTTLEAWQLANAQLSETKAPARTEDISLYQAQVRQAQATLDAVKKQIDDSILKAPSDGIITSVDYEIGEQTSAAKHVITLLGENNYEIEVDISEADIAKINLNNPVDITLDAYGENVKFDGHVVFVEPAETVIQDVIYYKVTVNFDNDLPAVSHLPGNTGQLSENRQTSGYDIKSGMTANVIITTAHKESVLLVPSRTLVERNGGGTYIRLLVNSTLEEKPITTGLRGDGGMVEVLSGVQEGEEVITYIKESN